MTVQPTGELDQLAYSVPDTARLLGLSREMVYKLIKDGRLPRVKIGTRTVVPTKAIQRLLEERQEYRR